MAALQRRLRQASRHRRGRRSCCCGTPMSAPMRPTSRRPRARSAVYYNYFGAWFKNERPIRQGLIERLTDEDLAANAMYAPEAMRQQQRRRHADEVIARLKHYEALGYDEYSFWIDTRHELRAQEGVARALHRRRHAGFRGVTAMRTVPALYRRRFEDGEATLRKHRSRDRRSLGDDARGARGRCRPRRRSGATAPARRALGRR